MPTDPTEASHRALREIRRQLERHPAVTTVRGFPPETHTSVEAGLDLVVLSTRPDEYPAATGTLTVRWFVGEAETARPEFSVHYSDESGVDCGWHHEPNTHVDEWGHFQARTEPNSGYTYRPYSFETTVPGRVIWEVLSVLPERLTSLAAER